MRSLRAAEPELLFQDVELGPDEKGHRASVKLTSSSSHHDDGRSGIDVGTLSGVSLQKHAPRSRRLPTTGRLEHAAVGMQWLRSLRLRKRRQPRRTLLQQSPDQMIRAAVDDPKLNLDNYEIPRRRVTAFPTAGERCHASAITWRVAPAGSASPFRRSAVVLLLSGSSESSAK